MSEENKQNILDFFGNREVLFLPDYEQDSFVDFINTIAEVVVQYDGKKEQVVDLLTKNGLDKIVTNLAFDYAIKIATKYLDAKMVKNLDENNFLETCNFIVNKMLLYSDHLDYRFKDYFSITGFDDEDSARRVFRFLRSLFLQVSSRRNSVSQLKEKLLKEYDLPAKMSEIIIKLAEDNLNELQQAYLLRQIRYLSNKIEVEAK